MPGCFITRLLHAAGINKIKGAAINTNYEKIIQDYLSKFYDNLSPHPEMALSARREGNHFYFQAFGETCCLKPGVISLSGKPAVGPKGLIISLYANYAKPEPILLEPLKAFKDFPSSMPYQGAFAANSERLLIPYVTAIKKQQIHIQKQYNNIDIEAGQTRHEGDFSFILYPLPKIALLYIFYLPDEEFPASATCLFSSNAMHFMPLDGIADTAEHTSRKIIQLIDK